MTIRRAFVGVAMGAGLLVSASEASADGPSRRSGLNGYSPTIDWSGFYVGIQGGYGWGNTSHFFTAGGGLDAGSWDISGGLAGMTLGTNWQKGYWVYGFESDFSFSGISGSFGGNGCNPPVTVCYTDIRNLGTTRARLGYAVDNRLVYLTSGLAYGSVDAGINSPGRNEDKTRWGWALGAGLEWTFAPRWSLKAEYLHVDLGDRRHYDADGGSSDPGKVGVTAEIARVGVNYSFGPGFWNGMLGGR